MPRPWDYPRWRRVLMQAVMWLILGGTLGLAQFITYKRSHAPLPLSPPIRVGPVAVRIPEGWVTEHAISPQGITLQAADPESGRMLSIVLLNTVPAESPQDEPDAQSRNGEQESSGQPINFPGLHREGLVVAVRQIVNTRAGPRRQEGLRAVTTLPTGGVLFMELTDPPGLRLGPADRVLLQNMADAVVPVGGAGMRATPKAPPPAPDRTTDDNEI